MPRSPGVSLPASRRAAGGLALALLCGPSCGGSTGAPGTGGDGGLTGAAPDIDLPAGEVDFGAAMPGGEPVVRELRIFNTGAGTLLVAAIFVREDDATPEFSTEPGGEALEIPIGAGAMAGVTVTLTAVDGEADHGTLHVYSNDPDEPHLAVRLTSSVGKAAVGGLEHCALDPGEATPEPFSDCIDGIDFEGVRFGAAAERVVALRNDGSLPSLLVRDATVTRASGWTGLFSVDAFTGSPAEPVPATLPLALAADGAPLFVRVTLAAIVDGELPDEELVVESPAAPGGELAIPIHGRIAGCPPGRYDFDRDVPGCETACTVDGPEVGCDGRDNDCDGLVDEEPVVCGVGACLRTGTCVDGASTCVPGVGSVEVCNGFDDDCDGTVDGLLTTCGLGECQSFGICLEGVDTCRVGPSQPREACNGRDDTCDGSVDEGCDDDNDGYCDLALGPVAGANCLPGDCADLDRTVYPGAPEDCDGRDNDCARGVDDGCDDDDDDYCDADRQVVDPPGPDRGPPTCRQGGGDCDDQSPGVHPGAVEVCDCADQDCDDVPDDGLHGAACDGPDLDGCAEGFFSCVGCVGTCGDRSDDTPEICNNLDDDCNGVPDNGCDDDGDDHCDAALGLGPAGAAVCPNTVPGPARGDDCDDACAACTPAVGRQEVCDGRDDDCDGVVDDGCDDDGDDYCDLGFTVTAAGSTATCPNTPPGPGNDCDDGRADTFPGALEHCDGWSNDCDFPVDEGCDDDGDGHCESGRMVTAAGAAACPRTPLGPGDDCNDGDGAIHPSAEEPCDDVDNDCDTVADDGCDQDDDDYCSDQRMVAPGGSAACPNSPGGRFGDDCDDLARVVHPTAVEECDGFDQNCVLGADDGCDDDGDDWCDAGRMVSFFVGSPACPNSRGGPGDDCDDNNPAVHPGAVEVCNGVDDDCAGTPAIDTGCDDDGDDRCDVAFTVTAAGAAATCPATAPGPGDDCDDGRADTFPGALEHCEGRDNDCDAAIDEGCDDDGDDFCEVGRNVAVGQSACPNTPPGPGDDCDDAAPGVRPGAVEVCDGVDDNCVGGVDDGCDDDGDDWCDAAFAVVGRPAVCPLGDGDCDDGRPTVFPGNPEVCDNLNNDCSAGGGADEGCDDDNDGFCDAAMTVAVGGATTCAGSPPGAGNDCDDLNGAIRPGATEICNGLDENCAGGIDDGCDDDNDDHCDAAFTVAAGGAPTCAASPPGPGDDCNDNNAAIFGGNPEQCDNLNNDCDALTDEGCDDDADDFCDGAMLVSGAGSSLCPRSAPGRLGDDCDDGNSAVNPSRAELCNNLDDNCAGGVDDGCDDDDDGYCDVNMTVAVGGAATCPGSPAGSGNDCDDAAATVFPGNPELCDNLNNDCSPGGVADEGCDDDNDNYCDAAMTVVDVDGAGPLLGPATCTQGGGDCADAIGGAAINPGAADPLDVSVVGTELIDDVTVGGGVGGRHVALAIDDAGTLHVAYHDAANLDLKYARGTAGAFAVETVDAVTSGDVGEYPAIVVAADGRVHVVYHDDANDDLRHATRAAGGGAWTLGAVVTAGAHGLFNSLALVGATPHAVYYDFTTSPVAQNLNYTSYGGASWSAPVTVDQAGNVGQHTSIVAGADGSLHIAHHDATTGLQDLRYVRRNAAGSFDLNEIPDSAGNVGQFASIDLDDAGVPHIAYYDVGNGDLKVVGRTGGAWGAPTIADGATGNVGQFASLAVAGAGATMRQTIAYYDVGNSDLKLAVRDGTGAFTAATIDASGIRGQFATLALTAAADGLPLAHVVYYDTSGTDLRYARVRPNHVDQNCDGR